MQLYSAGYGIIFRILFVKTLVPERCAIFCWQVMKMFHLFLKIFAMVLGLQALT